MATPQTISCPICQQEHALFYVKHSNSDVTLNYICDRVPRQKVTDMLDPDGKVMFETRYATQVQEIPFQAGLDIPTRWSNQYAKKKNDGLQNTLPL